ncbi:MAG: DUF2007 domain-containing protein [Dysgonamonadaceae bacterium]
MDNLIEITRFTNAADAQVFMSRLRAEGIDCFLQNEFSSQVYGNIFSGAIKLEIRETDRDRALEIMKEMGYIPVDEVGEAEHRFRALSSWSNRIPLLKSLSTGMQIILLFLFIALISTAVLFFLMRM